MQATILGKRFRLAAGASAMAIVMGATPASVAAQTVTLPAAAPNAAPVASDQLATADDIVVTATRTTSLASKTPVALTAISGEALRTAGVTDTTELGAQVPNISLDRNGGLQITIRGVTSTDNTEKGDPSAAFMLDGIYIARAQAQEVAFFDLNRIEVLRGPQGTLYGRNTTAGVVNVITNKPVDHFEAAANAMVGNFNTYQADAMVNVPVSDTLAVRGSAAYTRRDNYVIDGAHSRDSLNPFKDDVSARLQALWHITPEINLLVRGDYSTLHSNDAFYTRATQAFDLTDPRNPIYISDGGKKIRTLDYSFGQRSDARFHTWGISSELNWDFGPMTMTYLGSYRDFERREHYVGNFGIPVHGPLDGDYWQTSHEVRFASNWTGPLKLQFGGYYFKEQADIRFYLTDTENFVGTPVFGFPQLAKAQSFAGFGQATYSITPELRLTGGVRYSQDDKSRHGATVFQQTLQFNPATDTALLNLASRKFHKTTWRAGLDYDLNSRTLLYGSVSTGYKAGGFNDGCLAGASYRGQTCNQIRTADALYYAPETLTAYEVGVKTHTADNTFRINGSAFYYDYNNLQLSQSTLCNGAPCQVTQNAAKARIKGIELESIVVPTSRNRFDFTFTYLDGTYRSYKPGPAGKTVDYSGRSLDRAPRYTTSAGYTYTYPLEDGGSISASARTKLTASYVMTNFGTPSQFRQPTFTRTDLTLGYNAPSDRWYVQAFARNLENYIAITSVDGNNNLATGDPRTFGVRAGVRF